MRENKDYLITEKPSRALLIFSIPMIIGNLFQQAYTIVDSATYYDNPVMKEVGWKFDALEFGYCNSLSFGYCIVTLILVAIVYKLLASRAVYLD